MDWVKHKGTTGKIEPSPQLQTEERVTFQHSITNVAYNRDIKSDLIIKLDQTSLSYLSLGKYTFNLKGPKKVPIKGEDDKRQIATTFATSATGNFLSLQLIYTGKTKRCLPNVEFPLSFHVTYTENFWSNRLKTTERFEKTIFPHLGSDQRNMAFPKEQMSLMIMDTFNW